MSSTSTDTTIAFRKPKPSEGRKLHDLIAACPPLDVNSVYAYFLLTHHHRDTCIVAEMDGEIVGAVTAYLLPNNPETIFVWQVAVDEKARGQGLAVRMLDELMDKLDVKRLETTISPDNQASLRTFAKLAQKLDQRLSRRPFLPKHACGEGHEAEDLIIIGPMSTESTKK